MKTWIVLIGLVAALGCGQAMAATDYRCTIERTVAASKSSLSHIFIGKQFTVERQTGVMAGTLKNTYVTVPQVIDYGSTENSFKAVTTMSKEQGAGAGSAIYALTINEYQDGTRKNFIFLQNDEVFLGWCEHF